MFDTAVRTIICVCLIGSAASASARDFRLGSNKAPATVDEAISEVKREVGKRSVEEHRDGDVIVISLDTVPKRDSVYSPSGSKALAYLQTACNQEFGGWRRDDTGRLRHNASASASGASHFTYLMSRDGDLFPQNFRPLFQELIDSVAEQSKWTYVVRPGDVALKGGYLKTDRASYCARRGTNDDQGERLVYLASSKYFDPKSGRYLLVVLRGQTLHALLDQARIDQVEFAATYAEQQRKLEQRKAEERQARALARDAELSAEIRRTKQFQAKLAIGDETQCGLVVDVRSPVAQVQTPVGLHWFRAEQLQPAGLGTCPKNIDPRTPEEQLLACQLKTAQCLNECNDQYPGASLAKPHVGWQLCRGVCEEDACQ